MSNRLQRNHHQYRWLIFLAFYLLLVGRIYQHFFWSTPYFAFFWDETIAGGFVNLLGYSWTHVVDSSAYLSFIEWFSLVAGIILFITLLAVLMRNKYSALLLGLSTFILLFFHLCIWMEYNFEIIILLEYSTQMCLVIYVLIIGKRTKPQYHWLLKAALSLTFIAHGTYALNILPVPGHFIDMTISILNISESNATAILMIAGLLDYIAAGIIFFPALQNAGLIYMVAWGFLTAAARIVAHFEMDYPLMSLHRWGFEFLVRTPHFMIPLALFYIYKKNNRQ